MAGELNSWKNSRMTFTTARGGAIKKGRNGGGRVVSVVQWASWQEGACTLAHMQALEPH